MERLRTFAKWFGKWLRSDLLGRVFFLFAGLVLTAVVRAMEKDIVPSDLKGLLISTILLVIYAGFLWTVGAKNLMTAVKQLAVTAVRDTTRLAESADFRINHVEERIFDDQPYQGLVFAELETYIRRAEREILVLTAPAYDGGTKEYQAARGRYLRVIEEVVRERKEQRFQNREFRYTRIVQVSQLDAGESIADHLAPETIRHCREMLQIAGELRRQRDNTVTIAIQKLEIERASPYILIDRKYVIIEADGIDKAKRFYIAGMFFIEDREGTVYRPYATYFDELYGKSEPLALVELGQAIHHTVQ